MDKMNASIIGIGLFAAAQLLGNKNERNSIENQVTNREEESDTEFIKPGLALNDFVSNKYRISFKYPKSWSKNPRYEDKYEGESGFFEIDSFEGERDNIDEAVNKQINEYYKPYGNNPTIRSFVIDNEPARLIYPSEDQVDFYKDREAALVVQYPEAVTIDGKPFYYVVIWASRAYMPLIINTLRFIKE